MEREEGWEEIITTKGRKDSRPIISIRKGGQIGFNQSALEKFGLEGYEYVTILYHKINNKLGFKFTNDDNRPGIHKLNKKNNSGTVSCRRVLEHCGIEYKSTEQYYAQWDEIREMAIIDITDKLS